MLKKSSISGKMEAPAIKKLVEMELNDFKSFIRNEISSGYFGKDKEIHYSLENDESVGKLFQLQKPEELLKNKVGLCFDIVELIRRYMIIQGIEHKVYYMQYQDHKRKTFYGNSILIYKDGNEYREFIDNRYPKDYQEISTSNMNLTFKQVYLGFIDGVKALEKEVNTDNFYAVYYDIPYRVYDNKESIFDFVTKDMNLFKNGVTKKEYSSMALVVAKKENKNHLLCIRMENGSYGFPKGHIEERETPLEAAIRECFEETGVKITKKELIASLEGFSYTFNASKLGTDNYRFFRVFKAERVLKEISVYLFQIDSLRETSPLLEENIEECCWFDLSNVETYFENEAPSKHNNLELIKEVKAIIYN